MDKKERTEKVGDISSRPSLHASSKLPSSTTQMIDKPNKSTLKEVAPAPLTTIASTPTTPAPPSFVRYADLTMLLKTSNNVLDAIQSVTLSKLGIQNEFSYTKFQCS